MFCLVACNKSVDSNRSTFQQIKIESVSKADKHLKDVFKNIRYVSLETNSENLIHRIDKLIHLNGFMLILDKTSQCIFIFSDKGKYKGKIDNRGKGPKEYVDIFDFDFDESKQCIVLNDAGKQALLYFDLNGKFLDYKKIENFELSGPTFISFNGKLIFNRNLYNIDNNYLGIFDGDKLTFEKSLISQKLTSVAGGFDEDDCFAKKDSTLYFLPPLANELYVFNKNMEEECRFDIVFADNNPDYTKINNQSFSSIKDFDNYIKSQEYNIKIRDLNVFGDYLYMSISNLMNYHVFYNVNNGKSLNTSGFMGSSDIYAWGVPISSYKNELIGVIDNPDQMFNIKITHKLKLNEGESNPLLAFYTMNDELLN